jgi:integrase
LGSDRSRAQRDFLRRENQNRRLIRACAPDRLAHDVLLSWKKEQADKSPFLFPSPVKPDQPITTVKTAWKTTLKNAGVAHFPIYHLRHVFCTRLSWVAPDAVVQRAMRHSSPETKRHYQLGMVSGAAKPGKSK